MLYSFQDSNNLYLVMELYLGGDLRYHLSKSTHFNEAQSSNNTLHHYIYKHLEFFIGCVLIALEYIHNNNVIHRDLKPENLICDNNGYVHVSDFGIAKSTNSNNNNTLKETSGTVGYIAPEVLCAQSHSFTVDFFALGVIAFELMFGRRPYRGKNRKEFKQNILSHQVIIKDKQIPNGWSKEAAAFINELIQRKVNKRLGCNGINEVIHHSWLHNFDWKNVKNKSTHSPFEPGNGDNYNRKYCECVDKVGEDTKERYRKYVNDKDYLTLFRNYTFNCIPREEIHNYYKSKVNKNVNAFKNAIALQNEHYDTKHISYSNNVFPKKQIQYLNDVNYYQALKYNNNSNMNYMYNIFSSSSVNSDSHRTKQKIIKLHHVQANSNRQCLLPFEKYVNDKPFGSRGIAIFQDKMKRIYQWNDTNSVNHGNINSNNSNNQSNLPFIQKNDSHSNISNNNKISIHKHTLKKNNSMAVFNPTHNNNNYKDIMKYQYKNTNYIPLNNVNMNNSLLMYNSFYN